MCSTAAVTLALNCERFLQAGIVFYKLARQYLGLFATGGLVVRFELQDYIW